ncbi:lytic transglycosylase domain-containing protein [Breznakiella homolactica]|uniref:Lytic transglycosylase domain-containing protein n=2 Tax=Breznakiella homolactica TaxID=2798577 RepID=A0A7T8BB13_9SPIR|nr:lytic transglycosylase domain-containing protein [Breznakiella homolactica]
MDEIRRIDPSATFYAGLQIQAAGDADRARELFSAAMASPLKPVREAALSELLPLLFSSETPIPDRENRNRYEGFLKLARQDNTALKDDPSMATLRRAAYTLLGRFGEIEPLRDAAGGWDEAFTLMGELRTAIPLEAQSPDTGDEPDFSPEARAAAGKILDFLCAGTPGGAHRWVYSEITRRGKGLLNEYETAAAAGRLAVARSAFGQGMEQFRTVLSLQPALFFHYPDLLNDLGRCFQFTQNQREGADLFLQWDQYLRTGTEMGMSIFTIDIPRIRYLLLYFAGRIERQMQNYGEAAAQFVRALDLAPDPEQEDACIWYILNVTLSGSPSRAAALVFEYAPRWHSDPYFSDILDRVSRHLADSRDWDTLLKVFSLIKDGTDGATIAQYAYIIGRALQEGYITPEAAAPYIDTGGASAETAFFRIAFEEGNASFYYRALAASILGETVVPVPEARPVSGDRTAMPHREELDFLLNFHRFGAAAFAPAYVQPAIPGLENRELRSLAEAFAESGQWDGVIRIMAALVSREGYEIERRDMELLYPQPFRELIEGNARDAEIPTEVLFGLIRTESAFVPDIASWAGAVGLAQLMPATAMDVAGRIARRGGPDYRENGAIDLQNPEINVHLGAWYLNYLIDLFDSPMMALIAYNAGIGRVRTWRRAEPALPEDLFLETIEYPETRQYGRKVLAAAAAYGFLYYDMTMEAVIADIFTMRRNSEN